MKNEKVTPGQCLCLGSILAGIINSMGVEKTLAQELIDNQRHPFWEKIREDLNNVSNVVIVNRDVCITGCARQFKIPQQGEFVVEKMFKESDNVRFNQFGGNFNSWFYQLREGKINELTVGCDTLTREMGIREIGSTFSLKVLRISHIYWLLCNQDSVEPENRLAVNGSANLFMVNDVLNTKRLLRIVLENGKWTVTAGHHDDSTQWNAGTKVYH